MVIDPASLPQLPPIPFEAPEAQFAAIGFTTEQASPSGGVALVRRHYLEPNKFVEEVITTPDGGAVPSDWNAPAVLGLYNVADGITEQLRQVEGTGVELFILAAMAPTPKQATVCPSCGVQAIVPLTAKGLAECALTDHTTHVCHPLLAGCNMGFRLEVEETQ